MDDIIKIVKLLEDLGLLTDCAIEAVEYEIKKQEGEFLGGTMAPLVALLIAPLAS